MNSIDGDETPTIDRDRPGGWEGGLGKPWERGGVEERPFGVSVVVFFAVLSALLTAFFALNAWIRAEELEQAPILSIVLIAEAVIGFVIAFGVWGLKEWARSLAIGLYGITFLINFFTGFSEPVTKGDLVGLIVPAAIIIYLVQPAVKDRFI